MSKTKFRINIIDFLPEHGKHLVGKDHAFNSVHFGDMVERNGERWFVGYRYGKVMLKRVGQMGMISCEAFDKGDFTSVTKVEKVIGAGVDWLIIGYTDDPWYEKLKHIEHQLVELNENQV